MTDEQKMWNPFANMGQIAGNTLDMVRASGCTVYDSEGRSYVDASGSLWYCNVGHGRTEIADAAAAQMRELACWHTFEYYSNPPAEALARRVAGLVPVPDAKVFFTAGGGSDAIDTAAKLARAYWTAVGKPEKRAVVSRSFAYHGMNAYGTSLGGIPLLVQSYEPLVIDVERVAWDDAGALADALDRTGPERVAAFFCEPVIGAGGVLHPPEGYLAEVQRICRERDVLFVADEVICGFGRTGNMFGTETYGLKPDIMTMAKALSSAYLPISATVISDELYQAFVAQSEKIGVFAHGFTYSAHPACCAVALETLKIYEERNILAHVRAVTPRLQDGLRRFASRPLVGEVRGVGLIAGVELVRDKATKAPFDPKVGAGPMLAARAQEHGLILRAMGDTVALCPPLIITADEIDEMLRRFGQALDDTEAALGAAGLASVA